MTEVNSTSTPTPAPTPYAAPAGAPAAKWNVLSIVSIVTAVLQIGLAAVITGHVSLSQIKKTGEQGRVLAIIGLVVGYLEIVAWGLFILFAVILAGLSAVSTVSTY
jgi:hypothetical protein